MLLQGPPGTGKTRTVLGGDRMKFGYDYWETNSPTANYTTARTVCAAAAHQDMVLTGSDDTQAYLQADPSKIPPRYAKMPEGYESVVDGVEHCVDKGGELRGLANAHLESDGLAA